MSESFGLILQNLNLICVIGTVESYLGFWGERINFGITIAEIQPKVWERRRKSGERKCWISATWIPKFLCPILLPESYVLCAQVWSAKKKQLRQCHYRNREKKENIFLVIVAMELPKMGKKNWMELWQCHCRKWEEKKKVVAKIWEEIKKKKCYVHNIFIILSQQITGY